MIIKNRFQLPELDVCAMYFIIHDKTGKVGTAAYDPKSDKWQLFPSGEVLTSNFYWIDDPIKKDIENE